MTNANRTRRTGAVPKPADLCAAALVAAALWLGAPGAGLAQQSGDAESDGERIEIKDEDCAKLPGGNAPINAIARIQGGMSVENLEFTYFEKKLFELTREDFDYLKRLLPYCRNTKKETTDYVLDRLGDLILEAQETREKSIAWIEATVARLEQMPATPDAIRDLHNIWAELQNRRFEMTRSDSNFLAEKLDETRTRIYEQASTSSMPQRTTAGPAIEVAPFLPAVPETDRKPDPG